MLKDIHRWALEHFTFMRDEARWPGQFVFDHWETDAEINAELKGGGKVVGDCDAFAKMCWNALRARGIKARLVMCQVETGEWHLVCESDGWVLDNRQPTVMKRDELEGLGYVWGSMSGFAPGEQWTTIREAE